MHLSLRRLPIAGAAAAHGLTRRASASRGQSFDRPLSSLSRRSSASSTAHGDSKHRLRDAAAAAANRSSIPVRRHSTDIETLTTRLSRSSTRKDIAGATSTRMPLLSSNHDQQALLLCDRKADPSSSGTELEIALLSCPLPASLLPRSRRHVTRRATCWRRRRRPVAAQRRFRSIRTLVLSMVSLMLMAPRKKF